MASRRIAGITIELNGDTTGLNKALKGVDTELKNTKTSLKDVEKLLKLDPDNVELLEQKQKLLNEAIEKTTDRLDVLKDALTNDLPADQYDALQREIIATQQELDTYQQELDGANGSQEDLADGAGDAADEVSDLGTETEDAGESADDASEQWSAAKQVLADMVTAGIQAAIDGLGKLVEAFGEAMEAGRTYADEMLTLSIQTGLSTDTLQEFKYMAELIDVPLDTVVSSLTKLETQMIKSKDGTSGAASAFNELGVGFRLSNGQLRDTEAVFYDVIDALGQMEDPTEADRLAMEIFGKSFKDIKPLVAAGSEGIEAFKQEAHDMGYVMDTEMLETMGNVDDAYQRMVLSGETLTNNLAYALAPAFTELYTKITEFTQDEQWQETFATLGEIVQELVPVMGDVLGLLSPIFEALSPITELISVVLQALAPLIAEILTPLVEVLEILLEPITELLETLLPPLVGIIEALVPLIEPIGELIGSVLTVLEPLTPILEIIIAALELLASMIAEGVSPVVEAFAALLRGDFQGALDAIGTGITSAKETWDTKWSGMKATFGKATSSLMTSMSTWTSNFKTSLTSAISSMGTSISTWASGLPEKFSTAFTNAKTAVSNALDVLKSLLSGSLSFPHINLPHISISGSFSLNPPSVPSISVSWYAKAMKDGMILNNPTIFGAMNGKLLGGGEAGAEAVVGVNSLRGMIQQAVNNAGGMNLGGVTIMINGANQSVSAIADAVEQRLNSRYLRKVAVQR